MKKSDELPNEDIFADAEDEFEEITADGWEEANKEAGRLPLDPDDYHFQVKGYEVVKTKKGQARAMISCAVVGDAIPELNGRTVRHGLMLEGAGFGMTLGFAEAIGRKFSGSTKILTKDGKSPWIDTWVGALFDAHVAIQKDQDGNLTRYNEIAKVWASSL